MVDTTQNLNLHSVAQQLDADASRRTPRTATAIGSQLPSQQDIDELVGCYRNLLFPGVFSASDVNAKELRRNTEFLLQEFCERMQRLVCWTFDIGEEGSRIEQRDGQSEIHARATVIASKIADLIPKIAAIVATDVDAAVAGDPACQNPIEVVICYPGFHALMTHRFAHELWNSGATLLARMIAEWSHGKTGIDIHPQAGLGHHLFIDHGTGVVLGQTCKVGNHVRIYQGVTLGALSFPKDEHGKIIREDKRHPTIEDHVVIYANSAILGGKTVVGHHSVIGSSVWLAESVEPFTTVVMEKPRLRFRSQQPTAFDVQFDFQI